MSPSKYWDVTGRDVPRDLFPSGRVRISLGTPRERYAKPRRRALQQLRGYGEWEVIRAIADGQIEVTEAARTLRRSSEVAALAELRAQVARVGLQGLPTIAEAVESYLKAAEKTDLRPKTLEHRAYAYRATLEHETRDGRTIGELPVDGLRPSALEAAIREASAKAYTREGIRAAWSAFFAWAVTDEAESAKAQRRAPRFDRNPAREIERWRGDPRPETASEAQVKALLGSANVYQEAYVRSLVQLGLRQGELRHTRLHTDLDLDTWEWKVQGRGPDPRCPCRACAGPGWQPKTTRSARKLVVPAGRNLRGAITAYLDAYPAEEGDFAFRRPDGRPWTSRELRRDFERLCTAAGVKYGQQVDGGITPHTLRHTCATNLIRNGVDSSIVAAILGDAVQTIVTSYLHLAPEDLARGVARGPSW